MASAALEGYVNRLVSVITADGRNFVGTLKGKCFTCVTKTIANLATYSRKPENYNGTIIFEFDIMKNSSPINLNLCQT